MKEFNECCHTCRLPRENFENTPRVLNLGGGNWGIVCKPCSEQLLQDKIDEWKSKEEDTEYTDEPICPNCGTIQGDAWEWAQSEDGEIECGTCDYTIKWSRHVSITYSTA